MSTPPRCILRNSLGIGGSAGEVAELTPNLPAAGPRASAGTAVARHASAATAAIRNILVPQLLIRRRLCTSPTGRVAVPCPPILSQPFGGRKPSIGLPGEARPAAPSIRDPRARR